MIIYITDLSLHQILEPKMKKLILLPLLALFIASCSTDDTDLLTSQQTAESINEASHARGGKTPVTTPEIYLPVTVNGCFDHADAQVFVNYPDGFGSQPSITFAAQTQGSEENSVYSVRLEVETLVDCEDLELGTGEVSVTSLGNMSLNGNQPSITFETQNLPADCYRWRFVFQRAGARVIPCTSYTQWYDAPLY
jgi:hypothetical protein